MLHPYVKAKASAALTKEVFRGPSLPHSDPTARSRPAFAASWSSQRSGQRGAELRREGGWQVYRPHQAEEDRASQRGGRASAISSASSAVPAGLLPR